MWGIIEERVQTTARSTTGRLNAQYVWSPVSVDALIERDRDSNGDAILDERVYALQDANWNVTALVAGPGVAGYAVGAIINRFAYSPYGTTQVMTPSWTAASSTAIPWKHTFQGLAANTSTGLYDARNRDYSPILGRFIEPDPIGFQAGDNNFYRFVGNGPVGRNDPMGLYVDLAIEVVSIGTGAWSFITNAWAGNLAAAGVDAAGVVIDVGLAIVPGAPGGTGLALKAGREAAERVAREAAERAAREASEQAARAAREAAEKAAKTGGSCAVPKIAAPRSHNELAQDFIRNPNEWERVSTQVGTTPAGKHKGGTNIESQWRNKRTGEQVSIHEAFNKAGKSIHPENASPNIPGGGSIRPRHRAKELE